MRYNEEAMDIRKFLLSTFLFESFTDKDLVLLEPALHVRKVRRGETVFSEGTQADAFFIVAKGSVKVYKVSQDGKEHTLHIHNTGDTVAEAALFASGVYPASCIAIEDSLIVRISREGFLQLVMKHPRLALKMMSGYSKRLRLFVSKIEQLSLKDIRSRLAAYLIQNSIVENGVHICRLQYSKKELASLLGTIPETLSRAFTFLKQEKLIAEEKKEIRILDPERLRLFSG